MSDHSCTELTDGCYRCDLNRDEIAASRAEDERNAQAAWIRYRDGYMRALSLSRRRASSQMRRREFIAGFMAGRGDW